jgi:hypothetical protein
LQQFGAGDVVGFRRDVIEAHDVDGTVLLVGQGPLCQPGIASAEFEVPAQQAFHDLRNAGPKFGGECTGGLKPDQIVGELGIGQSNLLLQLGDSAVVFCHF